MPLGNDVVDLAHPQNRPESIHPRFDTRVFTPRELDALEDADDRHLLRWTIWAAKEAAFKAARQIDRSIRMLPREFDVNRVDGQLIVDYSGGRAIGRLATTVESSADWVHVAAHPSGIVPELHLEANDRTRRPESEDGAEPGPPEHRVRRLARRCLGEGLGMPPAEIRIGSVDRIPRAERDGTVLPVDLSLSHDGRFVACAWTSLAGAVPARELAEPRVVED